MKFKINIKLKSTGLVFVFLTCFIFSSHAVEALNECSDTYKGECRELKDVEEKKGCQSSEKPFSYTGTNLCNANSSYVCCLPIANTGYCWSDQSGINKGDKQVTKDDCFSYCDSNLAKTVSSNCFWSPNASDKGGTNGEKKTFTPQTSSDTKCAKGGGYCEKYDTNLAGTGSQITCKDSTKSTWTPGTDYGCASDELCCGYSTSAEASTNSPETTCLAFNDGGEEMGRKTMKQAECGDGIGWCKEISATHCIPYDENSLKDYDSKKTTETTAATSTGQFVYTPMEEIPGFGRPTDFPSYVMALYKFGLWTIGLAALLMISIGGFMYITSAGNNSQMETAKKLISDSIIGIVLAFTSWILLYEINPDLVSFNNVSNVLNEAAKNYSGNYPTVSNNMPKNCGAQEWQTIFQAASQNTGVDKCVLQAVAAMESGCNKVPSRTQGGRDCSVVQIAAQENCGTTCDDLETNPQKAIECAAKYLGKCSSGWRSSPDEQKIRDTYAGYNGGCGALGESKSCSGMTNQFGNKYLKWDCPNDCGGYCPVPARTSLFLNYYNQCKNGG